MSERDDEKYLKLFYFKKEWILFLLTLKMVFLINISFEYHKYLELKDEEIYQADVKVIQVYNKRKFDILKLQSEDFSFFTSASKNILYEKLKYVNLYIVTKNIDFIDYLKGFYAPSFNIEILNDKTDTIKKLSNFIRAQHSDSNIASIFDALFFAIPLPQEVRDKCAKQGISHLVAISGFHLGVLSLVLYWIFYYPYSYFHEKKFPYRNKRFDILSLTILFLFSYLLLTGVVPSLLRAFVMFVFGIYMLRRNIKLVSFETLLIIVLLIISFFPKLLFSLSFWFSVCGVFYIYLFLKYFSTLNKKMQFVMFNFWIYLAINPITHYFFGSMSYDQLYSPILTLGFSLFYPLEIFLHIFGLAGLLDGIIGTWLDISIESIELYTPGWFFFAYIAISILSIFYKKAFELLNFSFITFNLWLFSSIKYLV